MGQKGNQRKSCGVSTYNLVEWTAIWFVFVIVALVVVGGWGGGTATLGLGVPSFLVSQKDIYSTFYIVGYLLEPNIGIWQLRF